MACWAALRLQFVCMDFYSQRSPTSAVFPIAEADSINFNPCTLETWIDNLSAWDFRDKDAVGKQCARSGKMRN